MNKIRIITQGYGMTHIIAIDEESSPTEVMNAAIKVLSALSYSESSLRSVDISEKDTI